MQYYDFCIYCKKYWFFMKFEDFQNIDNSEI